MAFPQWLSNVFPSISLPHSPPLPLQTSNFVSDTSSSVVPVLSGLPPSGGAGVDSRWASAFGSSSGIQFDEDGEMDTTSSTLPAGPAPSTGGTGMRFGSPHGRRSSAPSLLPAALQQPPQAPPLRRAISKSSLVARTVPAHYAGNEGPFSPVEVSQLVPFMSKSPFDGRFNQVCASISRKNHPALSPHSHLFSSSQNANGQAMMGEQGLFGGTDDDLDDLTGLGGKQGRWDHTGGGLHRSRESLPDLDDLDAGMPGLEFSKRPFGAGGGGGTSGSGAGLGSRGAGGGSGKRSGLDNSRSVPDLRSSQFGFF